MSRQPPTASVGAEAVSKGKTGLEMAGRVGYATKGVVYMIVGGLAAAAAWGAGGSTTGSEGAIREIGTQPFGQFLLWVVAAGLAAYCLWRLVEAIMDPERKGTDAKGIACRLGYAVSGIAYGMLAIKAAPLFAGSSGGGGTKRGMVAEIMSWPGGKWLVGIIGLVVIGYGCYQIYKGVQDKFMDKYDSRQMNSQQQMIARWSGRLGLASRGLTFCIIGAFVIIAAVNLDPSKVKGVGAALDLLASQPYGMWILLAVSLGLACYGVFCLIQARYRQFDIE